MYRIPPSQFASLWAWASAAGDGLRAAALSSARSVSSIHAANAAGSSPTSTAASAIVDGSSSNWPSKFRTRSRRSSSHSSSGACVLAATTARQAGAVAHRRGLTRVSIGIPCSRASWSLPPARISAVSPFSA